MGCGVVEVGFCLCAILHVMSRREFRRGIRELRLRPSFVVNAGPSLSFFGLFLLLVRVAIITLWTFPTFCSWT